MSNPNFLHGQITILEDKAREKRLNTNAWIEWVAHLPKEAYYLAREFPLWTVLQLDGTTYYITGYREGDGITISKIDPIKEYDRALQSRQNLCISCLKKAKPQ